MLSPQRPLQGIHRLPASSPIWRLVGLSRGPITPTCLHVGVKVVGVGGHESRAAWVAQQAATDASSAARYPGSVTTSLVASSCAARAAWVSVDRVPARSGSAGGGAAGGGAAGGEASRGAEPGRARRSSARSVAACAIRSAASALAVVAIAGSAWATSWATPVARAASASARRAGDSSGSGPCGVRAGRVHPADTAGPARNSAAAAASTRRRWGLGPGTVDHLARIEVCWAAGIEIRSTRAASRDAIP